MEAARQPLDPWQSDAIRLWLATNEAGKWACVECVEIVARQNGKGTLLEARVLTGLLLLGEQLIVWTAHEVKTAMEGFRRCKSLLVALGRLISDTLIEVDGVLIKVNNANGEEGFERLDTGGRIRFLARSKGSGRGFSCDLLILDEAFALTFEQYAALMYTMSARPDAQIIFTSSPPLTGDTGELLYALRDRGEAGDPTLCWRDWGAAGHLDDLSRVNLADPQLWAATNPAYGHRIMPDTVEREYRASLAMLEDFARERCGIWPRKAGVDGGWRVISEAAWTGQTDPDSQIEGRPAFGVWVPPDRSMAAIGTAGPRSAGGWHVELTGNERVGIDYRPGTGWVVARLLELESWDPIAVAIDDKALADEAEEAGLVVHRVTAADMVTGCQRLYDGVADPDVEMRDVWHIGQDDLTTSVKGADKRNVGGSWAFARADVASDSTPISSASVALFAAATQRVHRVQDQQFFASWR